MVEPHADYPLHLRAAISRTLGPASQEVCLTPRQPSSTEVPMRLIGLAVVLALSLFSASLAAEAQATRTPRIGYLGTGNATPVSAQLGQCPDGWPVPGPGSGRSRSRCAGRSPSARARELLHHEDTASSLNPERRYGLTGTSTNLSPVLTRTRRSTGVERPVGTVPR
jgi:hypothetical protein